MKKPIYGIITDLHLAEDNISEVVECCKEAIDKCVALQIGTLFIAGDVFNSRKGQPEKELNGFKAIIYYAQDKGVELIAIPGNHDKMNYHIEESYLDVYEPYDNFTLVRSVHIVSLPDVDVCLIPFFDERETYPRYLAQAKCNPDKPTHLITHIAINGVRNNDGSEVKEGLKTNLFKRFDRVFVGHYHDYQDVSTTIHYIGSLRQKNFAENDRKGITIVFDDSSFSQIRLNSTVYRTVTIDLEKEPVEQAYTVESKIQDSGGSEKVRVKVKGTKDQLATLDKTKLQEKGISVACKIVDPEIVINYDQVENFEGFTASKIIDEFDEFSEAQNVDDDISTNIKNLLKEELKVA